MAEDTAAGGETRTCPKCGETKPTSAFSRSSATKHGFQSRCKECKKAEARAGYAKNIEHYRTYHREKNRRRYQESATVEVECVDCGKRWGKRVKSLNDWQGHCGSCATKLSAQTPGMSEAKAERARRQLEAWGGRIPNSKPWGVGRPIAGHHHPRWKGGVTEESQRERSSARSVEWRRAVFARDDYTCQECGQRGYKLNAHHIKGWADYPNLRFELSNGVTLCKSCHERIHAEEAGRRLGAARDRARALRRAATG